MPARPLQRNAVREHGEGRPLVLAHGFGCDQGMWDDLRAQLPGRRCITYDLTGMGASDYAAYDVKRHGQLDGHAEDLIEILESLELGPVDVAGHSVAAMIVGLAGAMRPDLIGRIVMICPSPCYIDGEAYRGGFSDDEIAGLLDAISDNYQGWAGMLAGMVAGSEGATKERLNERFCKNDPAITQHFAKVTFESDLRPRVSTIPQPTLVIDADDDAIAPPEVGAFMHATLPQAERITLRCRGHAPHMTQPIETARAMEAFLE